MKKLISSCFLMIASSICFAQTLPDTAIYLTQQDAKIINLIINELDKCTKLNATKDTIIRLHEAKIKNLTIIEGLRSEQVINANIEIANQNKEIKRLKRVIFIHKVVFISGIVATIWLLK